MPLFYAYIANILDEATFRLLAIFASPAVADEWWRAVSASPHAKFIKRVAPQFYAHDAAQCNLSGFFDIPEFKAIAEMFRGRILFTQLNDGLLGIPIIPPQEVTDHISGSWYHIRSASNHALCWHYDAAENKIQASEEEPTQFRISIRKGLPEETILVGEDRITLYIHSQLYVHVEQSGQLKAQAGSPGDFRFREFENGNFAMSKDASVVFVDNADSTLGLMSWELSPALSPSPRETTPEDFDAENLEVIKSSNAALDARVKSLMQEAAYTRQKSQAAAAAAERELVDVEQQLDSIKVDLMLERVDAQQKSQAAAERSREEFNIMKSSKEALAQENAVAEQKSQVAAAVAETERADLKEQLKSSKAALVQERADAEKKSQTAAERSCEELDIIKSSKEALMQENAAAEQKWQVAAAAAETELRDVKQQLESSKADLVQERADAEQKSQAAVERSREELAKWKQQLKSSKEALVQERADARQKSQMAAAAERELVDWKQQLDVMKSSKATLDARVESLMQEVADAQRKSQSVAAMAERQLTDLRQQLDVTKSSNAALVQDSEDAEQKSQVAAAVAEKKFADVKRQLDAMKSGKAVPISRSSLSANANALKTNKDVIIAVMGATGSGKSTFINLISGSKLYVGTGFGSCTSDVDATAPFTFQDHRVVLLDTPGFDDTTKSDTDILKMIATFLASTYAQGATLRGVIYMRRIGDVRMGGIAVRNFSMFRKLCGDKSLKNVAIVTNFWSEVDPAKGAAREAELRSDDMFFKPVLDKQAKLLRHDGTLAGARMIVGEIVDN